MTENELSKIVVNAAYHVHTELGAGLLENVYQECLFTEIEDAGIKVKKEVVLPVIYKNKKYGNHLIKICNLASALSRSYCVRRVITSS
jgi:GxxExxY protein